MTFRACYALLVCFFSPLFVRLKVTCIIDTQTHSSDNWKYVSNALDLELFRSLATLNKWENMYMCIFLHLLLILMCTHTLLIKQRERDPCLYLNLCNTHTIHLTFVTPAVGFNTYIYEFPVLANLWISLDLCVAWGSSPLLNAWTVLVWLECSIYSDNSKKSK